MDNSQIKAARKRAKRAVRVRKHLRGTTEKPRLCVIKSNCHIHVQLIDDEKFHTLASVSTLSKEFKNTEHGRKNKDSALHLGAKIAELAKAKNVKKIVFDRGPFKYHGVIAAVAQGARDGGLEF